MIICLLYFLNIIVQIVYNIGVTREVGWTQNISGTNTYEKKRLLICFTLKLKKTLFVLLTIAVHIFLKMDVKAQIYIFKKKILFSLCCNRMYNNIYVFSCKETNVSLEIFLNWFCLVLPEIFQIWQCKSLEQIYSLSFRVAKWSTSADLPQR